VIRLNATQSAQEKFWRTISKSGGVKAAIISCNGTDTLNAIVSIGQRLSRKSNQNEIRGCLGWRAMGAKTRSFVFV
jgi:hypothetical protein